MALRRLAPGVDRAPDGMSIKFSSRHASLSLEAIRYLDCKRIEWYCDDEVGIAIIVPSETTGYKLCAAETRDAAPPRRLIWGYNVIKVWPQAQGQRYMLEPYPALHARALCLRIAEPLVPGIMDPQAMSKRRAAGREHVRSMVIAAGGRWKPTTTTIADVASRYDLTTHEVRSAVQTATDEYAAEMRERRVGR